MRYAGAHRDTPHVSVVAGEESANRWGLTEKYSPRIRSEQIRFGGENESFRELLVETIATRGIASAGGRQLYWYSGFSGSLDLLNLRERSREYPSLYLSGGLPRRVCYVS